MSSVTDAGQAHEKSLGNTVLDRLDLEDLDVLKPHLSILEVAKGEVLTPQGELVAYVHFPVTADLSNVITFSDGRSLETSSVSRDGMSGLAAFLAEGPIAWDVVVRKAGRVRTISADLLRRQVKQSPRLLNLLLVVTHENQAEAALTSACNALHEVTPRLARWLLLLADHTGDDELSVTQQDVATMLGTQRTSINASAAGLRAAGAINYRRGRLTITNRPRLEREACECYAIQRDRAAALAAAPE